MQRTGWEPARWARWSVVLLGVVLGACGPAPADEPPGDAVTVPESEGEASLPLAPFEQPEDVREALGKSSGISHPFDVSRPSLLKRPTGRPGVGVAFDGKQYLVVWEDERTGSVFGARVRPDGKVLDPAGIPLNLGTRLDGGEPRVAWDGTQFVVVWVSGTDGVFGAHVDSDGDVRRHFIFNFSGEVSGPPGIACARKLCLVAYTVSGDDENVVAFDRVEADGDVLDGEVVSPAENIANDPAVAWDGKRFLIVWSDERGGDGTPDIYGTRVEKDGDVLEDGGVPLVALPGAQLVPDVAWTGSRFFIVWQAGDVGAANIAGARFRSSLTLDGPPAFGIATGPGDQTNPRVAPSGSKSLVVWDDTRLGPHRARGVRVGDDGSILGSPSGFTISSGDAEEELQPAVAAGDHQFFVAFAGGETGTPPFGPHHILGTRVRHDDSVKDSPALRLTRSAYPQGQSAAALGADVYLVVWREVREGTPRLLATRVRPDGRVLDVPVLLPAGTDAREPAVAWGGDGWLVVWEEGPFGDTDIRGARLSGSGLLLDAASLAIAALPDDQFNPAVASNFDTFLVVWTDGRGSFFGNVSDIVGTRVSLGGTVLDPGGFPISSVPFTQEEAAVVATGDLRYLVAWLHVDFLTSPLETEVSVRGARVDADGTVLDVPERIFAAGPAYVGAPPALAFDGTNTLVAWTSGPIGSFGPPGNDVLATRVDEDGDVLDAVPRLVASGVTHERLNVTATFDGTDFWLAWEQNRLPTDFDDPTFRTDVYGARVRTSGTVRDPGGRPIAAHQPEPEFDPVIVSALSGRVAVFYTEFVTDEDAMNLRIQGRVLTGLGASATEGGPPAPAAAR
ncbi:hypothetical protein [Pyxidicoccus xibeiensis]|uniref:hypothetical protein n=1 Tax=Pyxidicoccus xibeiensis TaxID=2906759 RepID=UPI0020A6E89E|nr:hypothetical protein [Pyxidicoccus xibeiensis]MCP3140246.1 hypothetical protein [Pyxidicoccus xibeiensis]